MRLRHGLTETEVAQAGDLRLRDVSVVESGHDDSDALKEQVILAILRASRPSRVLELHRDEMREYLTSQGASDLRVFGSTARGEDRWDSDLDIMATLPEGASLFDLYEWETHLRQIVGGTPVDLVPRTPRSLAKLASSRAESVAL